MPTNSVICLGCGAVLELQVCRSAAGYYVGYWCSDCGPYSRISDYFSTKEEAEKFLAYVNVDA